MCLSVTAAEFDLGRLQNVTEHVDDVVLPPWAKSPYDFIFQHMQALVCFPFIIIILERERERSHKGGIWGQDGVAWWGMVK